MSEGSNYLDPDRPGRRRAEGILIDSAVLTALAAL
jgi:hypothetical protein